MGGVCNRHVEIINAHEILVVKPEGKRPLGRTRRKWEDNIKMENGVGGRGLDSSES
jgi:hypothetical protein